MKKMMTPGMMNSISNPKKTVGAAVAKKAIKKAVGKAVAKKAMGGSKKAMGGSKKAC